MLVEKAFRPFVALIRGVRVLDSSSSSSINFFFRVQAEHSHFRARMSSSYSCENVEMISFLSSNVEVESMKNKYLEFSSTRPPLPSM